MLNFSGYVKPVLDPARAVGHVRRFRGVKLLAVGDLMLDHTMYGAATRISPEAPVPVVEIERESYVPGGMGNAGVNAAMLGAAVFPVGVIGEDMAGERLQADLAGRGMAGQGLIRVAGRKTTLKSRVMAGSQHIVRLDVEDKSPIPDALADRVLAACEALIEDMHGVMICDYAKGLLTDRLLAGLLKLARRHGKPVCVDPKRSNFAAYRTATVITPNLKEASEASRLPIHSDDELSAAAERLLAAAECGYLLITLGQHGLALFGPGEGPWHVNSTARQVFDVTGAGDTVIAALSLAIADGVDIREAIVLANCAAGLAVEKRGTAGVSAEELIAATSKRAVPTQP